MPKNWDTIDFQENVTTYKMNSKQNTNRIEKNLLSKCSTSSLGGNQVDGLPPALSAFETNSSKSKIGTNLIQFKNLNFRKHVSQRAPSGRGGVRSIFLVRMKDYWPNMSVSTNKKKHAGSPKSLKWRSCQNNTGVNWGTLPCCAGLRCRALPMINNCSWMRRIHEQFPNVSEMTNLRKKRIEIIIKHKIITRTLIMLEFGMPSCTPMIDWCWCGPICRRFSRRQRRSRMPSIVLSVGVV